MMITKLWQTLDQWSGAATTQREWQEELGEEWSVAKFFLRKSGRCATELACPKSSENACSRQIIKLIDGKLRAECGDLPSRCNHIPLQHEEISILEIDRARLALALAGAFNLTDKPDSIGRQTVQYLGRYEISAGQGFPVFWITPHVGFPLNPDALSEFNIATAPKLLLTPTRTSLDDYALACLRYPQSKIMALQDVVCADGNGKLMPVRTPDKLFSGVIASLDDVCMTTPLAPRVTLPAGTNWNSVKIEFVELEIMRLTVNGQLHRLGPEDLGLKKANTQTPKTAWAFLRAIAQGQGRINRRGRTSEDRSRISKQKQAASRALRDLTGLAEDPIRVDGDDYVTQYITRADDLNQGRQGQG